MGPSWSWASLQGGQTLRFTEYSAPPKWNEYQFLLEDAIKEVQCEPKSPVNPFGEVKEGHVKIEATLYPWYVRRYCRKIGFTKHFYHKNRTPVDVHIKQRQFFTECVAEKPELEVDGAVLNFLPDTNLQDELAFEAFCDDAERSCGLSQVFLLHSFHGEEAQCIIDMFLLLQPISPAKDKPKCYRRIGMMKLVWTLSSEKTQPRTWNQIVDGKLVPQKEIFWIL
jgi:hypothetical protein